MNEEGGGGRKYQFKSASGTFRRAQRVHFQVVFKKQTKTHNPKLIHFCLYCSSIPHTIFGTLKDLFLSRNSQKQPKAKTHHFLKGVTYMA